MTVSTSDLADQHPDLASCRIQFRIFGRRKAAFGQILTVQCNGDNALIRQAFSKRSKGKVLVVDGGGSLERALVGDNMAKLAMESGFEAVIINGAVRDAVELETLDFCIKALGTNPLRPGKTGEGRVDVPVSFGGVEFVPGHWLYTDEDGIVVSPTALHG